MVEHERDTCAHGHQQLFGGTRIEVTLLQSRDEPFDARDPIFSIGDALVDVSDRRVGCYR